MVVVAQTQGVRLACERTRFEPRPGQPIAVGKLSLHELINMRQRERERESWKSKCSWMYTKASWYTKINIHTLLWISFKNIQEIKDVSVRFWYFLCSERVVMYKTHRWR